MKRFYKTVGVEAGQGGYAVLLDGKTVLTPARGRLVVPTRALADAIAIAFAAPLFMTALSGPLLKEQVGWRRWSAVLIGFVGVVIAVRPGQDGISYGTFLALCAAGAFTGKVARWDGARWSTLGAGFGNPMFVLGVYDDGNGAALYAGGGTGLERWDGSSWSPADDGLYNVNALAVFDDGGGPALYVGGAFTNAGGIGANDIARWDGTTQQVLMTRLDKPQVSGGAAPTTPSQPN